MKTSSQTRSDSISGAAPNFHIGFGLGTHFCLGANLARLEIRVVFEELLAHYADFEIVGDLEWTNNNRLVGLTRLPLRVTPKADVLSQPQPTCGQDRPGP